MTILPISSGTVGCVGVAEIGSGLEARMARGLVDRRFVDVALGPFDSSGIYLEGVGPEGLTRFVDSRDERGDVPRAHARG